MEHFFLQCFYAFLACASFSIVFDIKKPHFVVISSAIGAIGWAVFLLLESTGPDVFRYLLATVTISILAEICARILKAPATIFLLIGIIPLVPGSGLYYAMNYLINGNYAMVRPKRASDGCLCRRHRRGSLPGDLPCPYPLLEAQPFPPEKQKKKY